jgi:heme-degrading monooxygenase HmoA
MAYICIWEYEVKPELKESFINSYNSDGDWTKLFGRSQGYIRTELFRERAGANSYITIDYWESEKDYDEFMNKYFDEYNELDNRCESFTVSEIMIGSFDSV